jgi:hypothetical protein
MLLVSLLDFAGKTISMPESERTTVCLQCQKLVGPGLVCSCLQKPVDPATIAALEELRDSLKERSKDPPIPGLGFLLLLTLSMMIALIGSAITMFRSH